MRAGVRSWLAHLGVAVSVCAACSDAPPSMPEPDVPTWVVDDEPFFSVGEAEGTTADVLTNALHGTVLSDGTVVMQNSIRGLFELRYYGPDAELRATSSRWGRGPYEFERSFGVTPLPGDSIHVLGHDGRFAVFGPDGGRVREGRLDLNAFLPTYFVERLDEDVWIGEEPDLTPPDIGLNTHPRTLLRLSTRTGALDTLEVGRYRDAHFLASGLGTASMPTPFAAYTAVAVGDGAVWVGDTGGRDIRRYSVDDAEASARIQLHRVGVVLSGEDRRRMRERYATHFSRGDAQRAFEGYAATMPFPERMPVFAQLVVDRLGMVWVQWYEPPWAEGPQEWSVFAADGSPVADVSIPAAVLPRCARHVTRLCGTPTAGFMEVGADYILVRQRDEWGVERVRKYRLTRGES